MRRSLTLRTVGFTIALIGAYGVFVYGPGLFRRLRRLRRSMLARTWVRLSGRGRELRWRLAAALTAGVVLLLVSPLLYQPITPEQAGDAGYMWRLSEHFPELLGSSLPFWVLVPVGCAVVYLLVRRSGIWALPSVKLACFLLAALPVRLVYQKYFDPFALLVLALLARPSDLRKPWDFAGIAVLYALFVTYALSFAG